MIEEFPRSASIKGKRKNSTQECEQSKDNGIMNDEHFGKKFKVSKPSTSSYTNLALYTILEPYTYLRTKTKVFKTTQCGYNNDSFKLILNDFS